MKMVTTATNSKKYHALDRVTHAFGSSAASKQGATRNKSLGGAADQITWYWHVYYHSDSDGTKE